MARDVIIPLDYPSEEEALGFLKRLGDIRPYVKVGMELYYREGAALVRKLKERGHKVFLDLKLHDIPNTVKRAMSVLSELEVDMLNVHAAGGSEMMKWAIDGATRRDGDRPLLIAVTQLTSTGEEMLKNELLIGGDMEQTVTHYAKNACDSGLDGVVCSPLEAGAVKSACGEAFLTVTPGIRFSESEKDDQVRITTPRRAREMGSDYIVVGRPITGAQDPVLALRRCISEFMEDEV